MTQHSLPIVGSFFRPPAKLVLDSLPIGAPLFLCAEPDNAYDPNAVAVWVASEDIPAEAHTKLEIELPNFGFTLDSFLAEEQWHLGYIKKEIAAELRAKNIVTTEEILNGTFVTANNGKPMISVQIAA